MSIKDHFDNYEDDGRDPDDAPRFNKECKLCGKGGLAWFEFDGKYVLINHRSEKHKCSLKPIDLNKLLNTKL